RLVEGRPAAVGVELGVRPEQFRPAGAADVDTLGLGVDVLPGEGALGAGLAKDVELLTGELHTPLGLALDHFFHTSSLRSAGSVEHMSAGLSAYGHLSPLTGNRQEISRWKHPFGANLASM